MAAQFAIEPQASPLPKAFVIAGRAGSPAEHRPSPGSFFPPATSSLSPGNPHASALHPKSYEHSAPAVVRRWLTGTIRAPIRSMSRPQQLIFPTVSPQRAKSGSSTNSHGNSSTRISPTIRGATQRG